MRDGHHRPANQAGTAISSLIRAWAKGQEIAVSSRGRVPRDVLDQFDAATPAPEAATPFERSQPVPTMTVVHSRSVLCTPPSTPRTVGLAPATPTAFLASRRTPHPTFLSQSRCQGVRL
ncbi:histone-like nucleoid-structuring protein Lsr2 [Rhodococcus sp. F64268]|uniref:Lsr2 family DNA-binding protein n=1 Tax=Rhodococcus sp. F64268 TaxID=2926402 RepID=UPI0035AE51DF